MWKQLWDCVVSRGWKNFEVHVRKSLNCQKQIFKGGFGKSSQRKEESCRECFYLLREQTQVTMNRMLVEVWTVRAILMKSQMEMKNMILETGRKASFHKVAKNLAELCSFFSVLWKVELISDEIEYLAKEIPKKYDKGGAWFFYIAYYKIQEERDELKMKLLSRKESDP